MVFNFPIKKVNDSTWFMIKDQKLVFGMVKLITLAISEYECRTYYRMIDENDGEYTIEESQIIDTAIQVPVPKYNVGDGVIYMKLNDDKSHTQCVDIIHKVEIALYERGVVEITYLMDEDDSEYVLEEEILSHGDPGVSTVKEVEEFGTGYCEYTGTGGSDI